MFGDFRNWKATPETEDRIKLLENVVWVKRSLKPFDNNGDGSKWLQH